MATNEPCTPSIRSEKGLKSARGRKKKDISSKVKFVKVSFHDTTLELWRDLKKEIGLHTDNDLALALISSYKRGIER